MKSSETDTSMRTQKPKGPDYSANVGITNLKDGAYDEAESHEGFLNALNAWREAGKPKDEKSTPSTNKQKKVKFNDVEKAWAHQQDESKKGSFFANIDKGNNDFNLAAIPTW